MVQRDIPAATREHLEDPVSPDALIAFLLIEHDSIAEPIRLVCDPLNFEYLGELWIGVVFDYTILDDGEESAAVGKITIPNVDRRIGEALRAIQDEAIVSLRILSAADFDQTTVPRQQIGSPDVIYYIPGYALKSVDVDAQMVTGQIGFHDYAQEPWPCVFASQALLPALYR